MQDADALLMVGSSFPYWEFLPKEGTVKGIQIDLSGRMLSIRYPMTWRCSRPASRPWPSCCRCYTASTTGPGSR
ncbi:MAG: hypothetical protein ACR2JO_05910 [Mycobacteriales bacterium]